MRLESRAPTSFSALSQSTTGISLHHLCLRIKDPVESLKFYRDILGMRLLFSFNAGCFSIYCELSSISFRVASDLYKDMYHGDEDTAKVWDNFADQKGLVECTSLAVCTDCWYQ